MTSISLSGVDKAFGGQRILHDLELTVPDGTVTAILGASGSGKSTMLRLIAGFEYADRGVIRIGERIVDDGSRRVHAQHRGIGYVAQDGALFPHLTVAGNIGFGMRRRDRVRLASLIDLVGLGGLERRYPHQLSGGQQQRVALARALATDPAVLLLDEPFSSLDAALRVDVRRDVARVLAESGMTAILVTHDQDDALSMADQVAVLDGGRLVGAGSPRELYDDPLDARVALRLGEVNVLRADLVGASARCALGTVELSTVELSSVESGTPESGTVAASSPDGSTVAAVLIRPEQVEVHEVAVPGSVAATVTRFEYFGHDALATLTLSEPALSEAALSEAALSETAPSGHAAVPVIARLPGRQVVHVGERVWLTVLGAAHTLPAAHALPAGHALRAERALPSEPLPPEPLPPEH
jgi:iron(III) transport system ATP-binding protein